MEIKFLDSRLTEFKPATGLSAGYDLRACVEQDIILAPGQTEKIPTGVALHMDSGFFREVIAGNGDDPARLLPCAIIMPRSGLGCKGVRPRNSPGLIDADYQGEIVICLYNDGAEAVRIEPLDRIAQLIFTLAIHPVFIEVEEFSSDSERGVGGFGSTGKQ